jgi:NTP pyrophosphatase (non-canonical NTP hydrolase)
MMDRMIERIVAHVKARDWEQFHNPKDLAISLSLEAAEVMEHFQWKNPEEMKKHVEKHKDDIADELIDVLYWVLLMSHYMDINLEQAFERKMKENERKYPADKVKGKHAKYTAYQEKSA